MICIGYNIFRSTMMGHHHATISFLSKKIIKSCWIINFKVRVGVEVHLIIILGGIAVDNPELLQSNKTLTKAVQNWITKSVIQVMSSWSWFFILFFILNYLFILLQSVHGSWGTLFWIFTRIIGPKKCGVSVKTSTDLCTDPRP